MNAWNDRQIEQHKKAAEILRMIVGEVFEYIQETPGVTEYRAVQFILKRFEQNGLITDHAPIVAFRENTAFVHYCPGKRSKRIEPDSLIMIDIWARLREPRAPYADITWMGYYGKRVPERIEKVFRTVLRSRDTCIRLVRKKFRDGAPITGCEAHDAADRILNKEGYESVHSTGHSLGFRSVHGGFPRLGRQGTTALRKNVGYTIEPGIYIPGEFGVRSEIDFYADRAGVMHITGEVQREMVMIG